MKEEAMSRTDAHKPLKQAREIEGWEGRRYFDRYKNEGQGVRSQTRRIRRDRSYLNPDRWDDMVPPTTRGAWFVECEKYH